MSSEKLVETPERIEKFLNAVSCLDWEKIESSVATADCLFAESTKLIRCEIQYYYKQRKRQKNLSLFWRSGMFGAGTLGVLSPLSTGFEFITPQLGYIYLGVATAFVAGNKLFGGTDGHARFVSIQLKLEELIAVSSLEWNLIKSKKKQPEDINEEKVNLITTMLKSAYKLIHEETEQWSDSTKKEIEEYLKKTKGKPGN